MKGKKQVLILIYDTVAMHPRVMNEIQALRKTYTVICAGFPPFPDIPAQYVDISGEVAVKKKILTFHLKYPYLLKRICSLFIRLFYSRYLKELKKAAQPGYISGTLKRKLAAFYPDIVISHNLHNLPVAYTLFPTAKKILNAHEYYPMELSDSEEWMKSEKVVVDFLCRKYLEKVDRMWVVSEGISSLYKNEFGIHPLVVTNAKPFVVLKPFPLSDDEIKIIHHGSAVANRHIEQMADIIDYLPGKYHLYLMLVPSTPGYLESLKKKYEGNSRIHFVSPVPTHGIPAELNKYDIGLYILAPVNTNQELALPNKFFEFIQARLAIAVAPSPEMAEYVRKYSLGIVSVDFSSESMAREIASLAAEDIMRYKNNADRSAKLLSSSGEEEKMLADVKELMGDEQAIYKRN